MRTHTSEFKEELKVFGRQIQGKIIYYPSYGLISEGGDNILTENSLKLISEQANYNDPIEISEEDIFSISIIKNGDLLQSLMKEFDFETKIELNIGSVVNPQFGLLVNGDYEYLNYGNYVINSKEFNMDTETWSYVCYDKMLFSMVKYRGLSNIEYPITIKQFINKLCDKVGLEFEDSTFVNQGQLIYEDLYKNRDVTYRDIFDEISKIVAGNLMLNDSDEVIVGYPNETNDTIDEDYLKDTNVRMSEKVGVINSVAILDSDNDLQYVSEDTQSIKENEMTRVTITDNLIAMNGEAQEIADNILNKLNGLYYYANDLQTTGVCYYDYLDLFNVEARGNIYQCLLLNNEITITQGIEEHIFTEKFEEIETNKAEYTTSVLTNKQASLKIDTQEAKIEARVEKDGVISAINLSPEEIQINANKISLEGKEINLTSDNIAIESNNFSVDKEGKITATAGDIGGFLTTSTSFSKELYGLYNYNYFDMTLVAMYIMNRIDLDTNLSNILDANDNGNIQPSDYLIIRDIIQGTLENTKEVSGKFELNSNDPKNCVAIKDKNNEIITSLGVDGINTTYLVSNNIVCGKTGTSYNDFIGATINGNTGNITCVSLTQTSKEENKKNFEKLTNAKDILNQVDIYKYNFKEEKDTHKKSIGFVIGDNFNYSQEITSTNNDGANIYSMVSVLWQVVKEQQEEINELKEMIKNGKY